MRCYWLSQPMVPLRLGHATIPPTPPMLSRSIIQAARIYLRAPAAIKHGACFISSTRNFVTPGIFNKTALTVSLGAVTAALTLAFQNQEVVCETPVTNKMTTVTRKPDISKLDLNVLDDCKAPMRTRMETYVKWLQYQLVTAMQEEENAVNHGEIPAEFIVERWIRKEGGEGVSCVIQNGATFEKGGANVSVVYGKLPPQAIRQMSADHGNLLERVGYQTEGPDAEVDGLPFFATGLSVVIHPKNPMSPTSHFNYRYFELMHPEKLKNGSPNPRYDPNEPAAWWFGGGADLTPIYLYPEDAIHFHEIHRKAGELEDAAFYPTWKKWCDKYFWITHRNENRGIGGIFFDDLTVPHKSKNVPTFIPLFDGEKYSDKQLISEKQHDKESLFRAVRAFGDAFIPAYLPLVHKHKNDKFNEYNVEWQQMRRGKYAEFNLVYDRGTKFGLMTPGARIESILMSLPLHARWEYMDGVSGTGRANSAAAKLLDSERRREYPEEEMRAREAIQTVLENPRDWL